MAGGSRSTAKPGGFAFGGATAGAAAAPKAAPAFGFSQGASAAPPANYPPQGAPSSLSKMKDESTLTDHNTKPNATLRVEFQGPMVDEAILEKVGAPCPRTFASTTFHHATDTR